MPLTDSIELSLFSGVIGEAIAEVKPYVVDDELQLDTQPINFTVNPATSIMPLSVFPEKDTVISSRSGTLTQTQNLFVGERVRGFAWPTSKMMVTPILLQPLHRQSGGVIHQ